ncbi:hypothetical protein TNCV_3731731 [Trichonephila clavipes]|nr:hypothetical protein TNCV_3731731 [Trichonephila clavipes]
MATVPSVEQTKESKHTSGDVILNHGQMTMTTPEIQTSSLGLELPYTAKMRTPSLDSLSAFLSTPTTKRILHVPPPPQQMTMRTYLRLQRFT